MFRSAYPDPVSERHFYADVPVKRALAWVIDTALIAFIIMLIVPFTGFLALFFLGGLYLVVNFVYRWIGLARHSATVGMRLVGVEFRDGQGYRLDTMTAFAHTLGYSLSVAFVFPQLISLALMAFSRRGQSLTDHVLGTLLVNRAGLY
ncbi:MAG: RDD family protein [Paracoccaceae bacterium]